MAYEILEINPTELSFCYNFTQHDCFELASGVCSLYLSEHDAQTIHKSENRKNREGSIMYCRKLASDLLSKKYFEDRNRQDDECNKYPILEPIHMSPHGCGHYEFQGGQHRTCIAKHLNIQSMFTKMENHEYETCAACREKEQIEKERATLSYKILSKVPFLKKKMNKSLHYFVEDEHMKFNWKQS